MKRILLVVAAVLLAGLIVVLIVGPRQVFMRLAPQIGDVLYVRAQGTGEQVREEVGLAIENNLIPVHIDSLTLRVNMEGKRILESNRKKDLELSAFSKDTLKLSATIQHDTVYEILKQAEEQKQDSLQVEADGKAFFNMPLVGALEVPFTLDMKIKAPRLPEISLSEISVEEVDLPDIRLTARLEIINRQSAEITIRQLDYEMRIDEDVVMAEGSTGENTKIEANDTTMLDIPVETSLGVVDDTIIQFIEEGTDWPVEMDTHVRLDAGRDWLENISLNMHMADTIDVMEQELE